MLQTSSGRCGKQQQKQNSPNLEHQFSPTSVHIDFMDLMSQIVCIYQDVIALIAVCEAVDHVAQTTPLHQGVITHLNLILMRSLIL